MDNSGENNFGRVIILEVAAARQQRTAATTSRPLAAPLRHRRVEQRARPCRNQKSREAGLAAAADNARQVRIWTPGAALGRIEIPHRGEPLT